MPCHWPLLLLQSDQKKVLATWENCEAGKRCPVIGAWQEVPGKRCLAKGARQEVPKAGESKHSCNCNRQLASCAIRWCESKYMHFFSWTEPTTSAAGTVQTHLFPWPFFGLATMLQRYIYVTRILALHTMLYC